MQSLASAGRLALYIDIHGHSTKEDVFFYGCEDPAAGTGQQQLHQPAQQPVLQQPVLQQLVLQQPGALLQASLGVGVANEVLSEVRQQVSGARQEHLLRQQGLQQGLQQGQQQQGQQCPLAPPFTTSTASGTNEAAVASVGQSPVATAGHSAVAAVDQLVVARLMESWDPVSILQSPWPLTAIDCLYQKHGQRCMAVGSGQGQQGQQQGRSRQQLEGQEQQGQQGQQQGLSGQGQQRQGQEDQHQGQGQGQQQEVHGQGQEQQQGQAVEQQPHQGTDQGLLCSVPAAISVPNAAARTALPALNVKTTSRLRVGHSLMAVGIV